MKRHNFKKTTAAVLTAALTATAAIPVIPAFAAEETTAPKYIFLFIGDGMS